MTEISIKGPALEDIDELYVRVSEATIFVGDIVVCGKMHIASKANVVLSAVEAEDLIKKLQEKVEELRGKKGGDG
jgi:hypothetical protein